MEKNKELTPMQEFIQAITENGLISINQTLIDGALKDEKQAIEDAFSSHCTFFSCEETKKGCDCGKTYYNTKYNNQIK